MPATRWHSSRSPGCSTVLDKPGLICDPLVKSGLPDRRLGPRDSFMEFAKPYWTTALRAKRSYRILDPDPEIRAERRHRKESSAFMLVNINEQVDPNAIHYWANQNDVDPPPNLVEYARRKKVRGPGPRHAGCEKAGPPSGWATPSAPISCWRSGPRWPRPESWPSIWSFESGSRRGRRRGGWPSRRPAFTLVDWAESCQNFTMALRGVAPARRAFLDSIYWTRALSVVLFGFGALARWRSPH